MPLFDQPVPANLLGWLHQQLNFQLIQDTLFLDSGQTQRFGHAPK
jgi:hypothetical protein